jgi:hypothetical protein
VGDDPVLPLHAGIARHTCTVGLIDPEDGAIKAHRIAGGTEILAPEGAAVVPGISTGIALQLDIAHAAKAAGDLSEVGESKTGTIAGRDQRCPSWPKARSPMV